MGFWKDGKKNGLGKLINDNKIKYGLWEDDNKKSLFKNEDEVLSYLYKNKLGNYKKIFTNTNEGITKLIEDNKNILPQCENPKFLKEYMINIKNINK